MRQKLANIILHFLGWKIQGSPPAEKKYIIIGAPHTSNWDFPLALLALSALGLRFFWVGKHTLFKGVAGNIFTAIGGIPVNRRSRNSFLEDMVKAFKGR
ncbi:MAG: 1-acyl-sn-glycerol-3-phosphate acyltransferase, partial [Desulforhopalus sp.]